MIRFVSKVLPVLFMMKSKKQRTKMRLTSFELKSDSTLFDSARAFFYLSDWTISYSKRGWIRPISYTSVSKNRSGLLNLSNSMSSPRLYMASTGTKGKRPCSSYPPPIQ